MDADGCMSKAVLEKSFGGKLTVPKKKTARNECSCLLGADIGAYNTCGHGCLYCYANYDGETVARNQKMHNVSSPLLIGEVSEHDVIKLAEQKPWKNGQLDIFDFIVLTRSFTLSEKSSLNFLRLLLLVFAPDLISTGKMSFSR